MVTSVLLRVGGGVPSVRRVVRRRFVAREVACDAGVRAREPGSPAPLGRLGRSLRGQPTYERSLHAGRPDTFNV